MFRLCGSRAEIDELKKQFDKGNNKIDLSEYSIHSVAGLLKLYLRELPEPILTFELYDCFIAAHGKLIEKYEAVIVGQPIGSGTNSAHPITDPLEYPKWWISYPVCREQTTSS